MKILEQNTNIETKEDVSLLGIPCYKQYTELPRVFNFSGGKTSAYMTIKYYRPGDIVLFCDTGREHPKTYKFINDFQAFENIPVHRISYKNSKSPFDLFLSEHGYKRLPNRTKRICTVELKVNTAKRYLKSQRILAFENFIGFRYDEPKRVLGKTDRFKKVFTKYPLFEDKITKDHINEFWKTKPYNLEIPSILGNCTLCFMKGQNAILAILSVYPELAEPWINDEQLSATGKGRRYFENTTMEELRNRAQNNLFKQYDLNEINTAFNCACTT